MRSTKPTLRQRNAFSKVVENGGNVTKAMIEAKYSPETAHTPQKLTESLGWKALCDEYGLTDDFLIKALVSDIKKKPRNRKPELELAFKVKGKLSDKQDQGNTYNVVNIFNDERANKIARRIVRGVSTDSSSSKE